MKIITVFSRLYDTLQPLASGHGWPAIGLGPRILFSGFKKLNINHSILNGAELDIEESAPSKLVCE
jgi:hypothetical protein